MAIAIPAILVSPPLRWRVALHDSTNTQQRSETDEVKTRAVRLCSTKSMQIVHVKVS